MISLPPTSTITTTPTAEHDGTLTFRCADCDEAFRIIRALQPQGYWAHILCLGGEITLHLRPLVEAHGAQPTDL